MPLGATYNTGTVSVTNGSPNVTGTGTLFTAAVEQGDMLVVNGVIGIVNTVTDDTHIVLFDNWTGSTNATAAYRIYQSSWLRYDPALTQKSVRSLLSGLTAESIIFNVTGSSPDPSLGEDGQWALKFDSTGFTIWLRTGGAWVLQGTLSGSIIRFDIAQSLTGGQQAQAQSNLTSVAGFTVTLPNNYAYTALSGNSSAGAFIGIGRVAVEGGLAVADSTAFLVPGTVAGDLVLFSTSGKIVLGNQTNTTAGLVINTDGSVQHVASILTGAAPADNMIVGDGGWARYLIDFGGTTPEQLTTTAGGGFTSGGHAIMALGINHRYGGSAIVDGRQSVLIFSELTSATSSSNTNRNYVALQTYMQALAGDGGTNIAPRGAVFGGSTALVSAGGWMQDICGWEYDIGAGNSGAPPLHKVGIRVALFGGGVDLAQGTSYDAAISVTGGSGCVGWKNGLLFSDDSSAHGMNANGTLIATQGSFTVTNGIDISSYSYTGLAWHSPGFSVTGSGKIGVGASNDGSFVYVNAGGTAQNNTMRIWSGASGARGGLTIGRTSDELVTGVAGATNNYFTGSAAGDAAMLAINNLFIGAGNLSASFGLKIDTTNKVSFGSNVSIAGSSASTTTATGALVLTAGGLGVFGDINWGGAAATSYTPTITSTGGTGFTATATGAYKQFGKLVWVRMTITISAIGSPTGVMNATLPINASGASFATISLHGEIQASHKGVKGVLFASVGTASITLYDGTFPGTTGDVIVISGWYESV